MFKIGDVVVKTKTTNSTDRLGSKEGDIWKINKETQLTPESAYYSDGNSHSKQVRKATEDEIKWFEAGITNINQIPEVGGTYNDSNGAFRTIKNINYSDFWIYAVEVGGPTVRFSTFINECLESYKPPVKSQYVGNEVPIDTPFEVGDLKNCKIGNLTPEDHRIIQPFLFSLGYNWSRHTREAKHISSHCLATTGDAYVFKKPTIAEYNKLERTEIKKETILNYIKQLNTNKNEVHRQNQEITRRTINGSARILSGRQQGSTGSRPKGNIQSVKGRETYFRRSEICGSVRLR